MEIEFLFTSAACFRTSSKMKYNSSVIFQFTYYDWQFQTVSSHLHVEFFISPHLSTDYKTKYIKDVIDIA